MWLIYLFIIYIFYLVLCLIIYFFFKFKVKLQNIVLCKNLLLNNTLKPNNFLLKKLNYTLINYIMVLFYIDFEFKSTIKSSIYKNKLNKISYILAKTNYFYTTCNNTMYKILNNSNNIIDLEKEFFSNITNKYNITFNPTNIIKYIHDSTIVNINIFYLRKSKIFNKSRYSRNRQLYRTGFYWSIYINIIAVIGFYFWFYKLTINFGYMWWFFYIFIFTNIIAKVINFKLYKLKNIYNYNLKFICSYSFLIKKFIFYFFRYSYKRLKKIYSIHGTVYSFLVLFDLPIRKFIDWVAICLRYNLFIFRQIFAYMTYF